MLCVKSPTLQGAFWPIPGRNQLSWSDWRMGLWINMNNKRGLRKCSPGKFFEIRCSEIASETIWGRTRAITAAWLIVYCIEFLSKPADIKFLQEKVLGLVEQEAGQQMVKIVCRGKYVTRALYCIFACVFRKIAWLQVVQLYLHCWWCLTRRTAGELLSIWNNNFFTCVFSSQRHELLSCAFHTHYWSSTNKLVWTAVILNGSEACRPLTNAYCIARLFMKRQKGGLSEPPWAHLACGPAITATQKTKNHPFFTALLLSYITNQIQDSVHKTMFYHHC